MELAQKINAEGVAKKLAGTKYDSGKPPLSLIPRSAIEAEGRVLAFGAKKYAPDNWRKGFAWRRLIDAALRHVYAVADGEDRDPETGELHAAHARCMLGFLIEHQVSGLGVDDRHTAKRPESALVAEAAAPTTVGSGVIGVEWGQPLGGAGALASMRGPLTAGAPLGGVSVRAPVEADGFRTILPRNLDAATAPIPVPQARHTRPFSFWYLATPYSQYPGGHAAAFDLAVLAASKLMLTDVPVYSPIMHSHPVAAAGHAPNVAHDFWMQVDRPMMDAASGIIVVQAASWETSKGMAEEIAMFGRAGKPIVTWDPNDEPPVEELNALAAHTGK